MNALPLSKEVLKRRLYSFLKSKESEVELMGLLGSEVCDSSYAIDRKGFPFVVVEFVESGSMDIVFDNKEVRLKRGGLLCYGPESRVKMKVPKGANCTKHFIAISPNAVVELESFRKLMTDDRGVLVERVPVIQTLKFISLISDLSGDTVLWEALGRVVDAFGRYIALVPKGRRTEVDAMDNAFRSVTRFISENFMQLKSLDEIAERCGYDKSYLCQLYKRYSEVSPYQQLVRMKISYACILIETTDWKINAIANAVGYEDALHFSRVFKQKVGVSPSQFRPE